MIFTGRAGRGEFWWFFLFWLMASVVAAILEQLLGTMMISVGVNVAFLLPAVAAATRRLHDTGRPGYYLLLVAGSLPFMLIDQALWGFVFLLTLMLTLLLLALPGSRGSNRYGADPRVAPDLDAFE